MAKVRAVFRCQECGGDSPKWLGRCPSCEAWNTLVEEVVPLSPTPVLVSASRPVPIGQVDLAA